MAEIRIKIEDMTAAAKRQLAVIGKHHKGQTGETLFATTVLSEIEEGVMPGFVVAAAQAVVGELSPIVETYKKTGEELTFGVEDSRWGEALPQSLGDSLEAYVVASVVASVLNMSAPEIAPKYATDMQQQMVALTRMAFRKEPPPTSDEMLNVSGRVTMEDEEKEDGYSKKNR